MFTYLYEDAIEVDLSLEKAWHFFTDPSNWPKWEDQLESCDLIGGLRAGAIIKAKIKNKSVQGQIVVAEVKPYHECKYFTKVMFFTQEIMCAFQAISPQRTRIISTLSIVSVFAPFWKKKILKTMEKNHSNRLRAFAEVAGRL